MSANQQARRACEAFNAGGIGQEVIATVDGGVRVRTVTKSKAIVVAHRYAAVELKSVAGLHLLSKIEPIDEHTDLEGVLSVDELYQSLSAV